MSKTPRIDGMPDDVKGRILDLAARLNFAKGAHLGCVPSGYEIHVLAPGPDVKCGWCGGTDAHFVAIPEAKEQP